ncbi:diaminopimelate epimerase [Ornithinibacillus massiliensis]|uniref:Diaminopimelate epimerase n=1 Tax=Ornithinibacillus massiliensis TaxID=1944633 RepID=A0ABS5MJ77_9BACI|nr:diaminopimelate epimerase [Ornithinibacillus massiliensis]MBS3682162.1 diaminopimelate epimerase [Ornithinibacillus massiliensis]
MEIPYIKMHGLGNNYIYLDLFKFEIAEERLSDIAQKVSNVNTGIGSDGLILIHPSNVAPIGMRIFNKDGSEGMSCGNGLRCTAKYAFEAGLVQDTRFQIETRAGNVEAEVKLMGDEVEEVTINMGKPILRRSLIPMAGKEREKVVNETFIVAGEELKVTAVSMGNPHAVFMVEDINKAPLYELGETIEKDPRFPEGVNVEFVEVLNESELNFRVWERGSGVTQACGTGACAAVVAATLNQLIPKHKTITVHLDGGDLFITWDENDDVWMNGGADIIASGVYHYR